MDAKIMLKLAVATVVKAGSLIAASVVVGNALGLPIGTTWWDGFVCGFGLCVTVGVVVGAAAAPVHRGHGKGLAEPERPERGGI